MFLKRIKFILKCVKFLSQYFSGFVRDHTSVVATLHCLNITTYICAISWILERVILSHREKEMKTEVEDTPNDIELK